jgi:hypothetical protein
VTAGVYRAFTADGHVLYIGSSVNPQRRIATHKSGAPWRCDVARWAVEDHPDIGSARAAETAAIISEDPPVNKWPVSCTGSVAPERCPHARCQRARAEAERARAEQAKQIRREVAAWPPLTDRQREQLALLLNPGAEDGQDADGAAP